MNKITIQIRCFGRKLGVTKLLSRFLKNQNYEEKFHGALLRGVGTGDIVWDIGANMGIYTELFSGIVGEQGRVYAIEPSPFCASHLKEIFKPKQNVHIMNVALSNLNKEMDFDISSGPESVTNHLTENPAGETVKVKVMTGDTLSQETGVPTVLKIDVEGFELDVLQGMDSMLKNPRLKGIYCEVHFRVLETRGMADAPLEIQKRLQSSGFQTSWVDASHIIGVRA
jgi:FkbM family methyltransferase